MVTRTEVLTQHVTDLFRPVLTKLQDNGYKAEIIAEETSESVTIKLVVILVEKPTPPGDSGIRGTKSP